MAYNYSDYKEWLLTKDGQKTFAEMSFRVGSLLNKGISFIMQEAFLSGDAWRSIACIDYMVELGLIKEIYKNPYTFAQHRVFTR